MIELDVDQSQMDQVIPYLARMEGAIVTLPVSKGMLAMARTVGRRARQSTRFTDRSGLLRRSITWRPKSTTVWFVSDAGARRRRKIRAGAIVHTSGRGGSGAFYGAQVEKGHRIVHRPTARSVRARRTRLVGSGGFVRGRGYLRAALGQSVPVLDRVFLRAAIPEIQRIYTELSGATDIRQSVRRLAEYSFARPSIIGG